MDLLCYSNGVWSGKAHLRSPHGRAHTRGEAFPGDTAPVGCRDTARQAIDLDALPTHLRPSQLFALVRTWLDSLHDMLDDCGALGAGLSVHSD